MTSERQTSEGSDYTMHEMTQRSESVLLRPKNIFGYSEVACRVILSDCGQLIRLRCSIKI